MGPVVIETERLHLREWTVDDAAPFSVLAKDPEVMRYISGGTPHTDEQIAAFIKRQIRAQAELGWCRWALQLRDPAPGEPTGVIGFTGPGCTFAPDVEVGWWVHRDLWGRGLAQEAAQAAVDHSFGALGLPRLICCVHPENTASLRVAEKTGFLPVDEIKFRGIRIIRHELLNPDPDARTSPGVSADCGCEERAEVRVVRAFSPPSSNR